MRISDWSSDVCSSDLRLVRTAAKSITRTAESVSARLYVVADVRSERQYRGCYGDLPFLGQGHQPRQRIERSEEHTSELQSLMRISYAVFCLKKKKKNKTYSARTHDMEHMNRTEKHTNTSNN